MLKKLITAARWITVWVPGLTCLLFAQDTSTEAEYWQQYVKYEIQVRLDDKNHFLHGQEKLYYTNNSPDTLSELYIHLWPNAYKDNTTAFAKQKLESGTTRFQRAPEETRGYIDSLDFQVDGQKVEWSYWENNWDIARVQLSRPLLPGESMVFTTPFRVKIPHSFSRLGHIKQQYQITQWYPKPAVYDAEGWHPMPYLDQGEFYGEFGTYDVWIELPANYVLGATGDMEENEQEAMFLNDREQISKDYLNRPKSEATFPDLIGEDEMKTLHFHQENVHDFAWFCDKQYYILRGETEVPYSGDVVKTTILFTNRDREEWAAVGLKALDQSIVTYSLIVGNYPYKQVTAVDGALSAGAGMEYPNITVVGAGGSEENLELVTMHEVGHNWFYGILGSNERDHPWMDEGLNSYVEDRYWKEHHNGKTEMVPQPLQKALGIDATHGWVQEAAYRFSAGENVDSPIEFPADEYSEICYGTIVYMKTATAFRYLEGYLGRETIDLCFQNYYADWKFKHPQPKDIQASFEKTAKEDLSWFFDGLIKGTEKLDFTISKIEGNQITVKNKSGIPLPCPINLEDKDGNLLETQWTPVFEGTTTLAMNTTDFHRAVVDSEGYVPEFRESNNYRRSSSFLPSMRAPRFNFAYKYPRGDRFDINVLPALGYNTTDGFMLGGLFHHGFYPKDRFEFHAAPMYGFQSQMLAGSAGFTLRFLPNKGFRKIELHTRTSSFSTILRSKHSLDFYFNKPRPRSPMDQKLTLNVYHIDNRLNISGPEYLSPAFANAVYDYRLKKATYDINLTAEAGLNVPNETYRGSLTLKYHQRIGKKYDLNFRAFAGGFATDAVVPSALRYGLNGSGDPFGESTIIDRAGEVNWLNRQIIEDHGGFRSLQANRFGRTLLTAGFTAETFSSLLNIYADVGTGQINAGADNDLYFTSGLQVNLPGNVLKVYLPLAGTQFLNGVPESGNEFARNISFSLTWPIVDNMLPK